MVRIRSASAVSMALWGIVCGLRAPADEPIAQLPAHWRAAWESPALADRPLQIVHELNLDGRLPEGMDQLLPDATPDGIGRRNLEYYVQRGLGGLVCNVSFRDYLRSESRWAELLAVIKACHDLGLIVWIYDEKGYPSGGAGGLVLEANRQFEAQELAYDPSQPDPFMLRPAYEHTHASNNYFAARRYANLLDARAVTCFLHVTHDAYYQRLAPYFGTTIQATFTDEPSLIAVNLGQIPEEVRRRVQVVDPLDPAVPARPCVPWSYDIAERYQERYAEDLLAQRPSLFAGDTPADRRVRQQFWSLVAELIEDRYFGALERWCAAHGIASSGHSLWEEAVLHHVPLEGNGLQCLSRMHIPGLDLLTSDPTAVIYTGWLTAGLPASAARLSGRRRVMTEVSDFSQKMGGQGPAALAAMQATAAWQAAWDVTDFTLYYSLRDRAAEEYRQYGDFVGRLNAILKPAVPDPRVLLYYPIYDLWSEYVPVAEPLQLASQSPRAQQLVASFMQLGQLLQRHQIPLTVIDHQFLARATVEAAGTLSLGNQHYSALLVPQDAHLPPEAAAVVERFQQQGGRVLRAGVDSVPARPDDLARELQPPQRLEPACDHIACGRFVRDGQLILLLVNVGQAQYVGQLQVGAAGSWVALDPATGAASAVTADTAGNVPVHLGGYASRIIVRK